MLRVNAVKELPALSRMGDVDAWIAKAHQAMQVADGPDPVVLRCGEVRRVVITGTQSIESPGVCLGGSIMLMESRRVRERRLRPQAGCIVQRLSVYRGECRLAIQLHCRGGPSMGGSVDAPKPDRRTRHVCDRATRKKKDRDEPGPVTGTRRGRGHARRSMPVEYMDDLQDSLARLGSWRPACCRWRNR